MSDLKIYNDIPRGMPPVHLKQPATHSSSFRQVLNEAVQQLDQAEKSSKVEVQKFLSKDSDFYSVMIALERADLPFQPVMQVRDKIIQAYEEIMKLQV